MDLGDSPLNGQTHLARLPSTRLVQKLISRTHKSLLILFPVIIAVIRTSGERGYWLALMDFIRATAGSGQSPFSEGSAAVYSKVVD